MFGEAWMSDRKVIGVMMASDAVLGILGWFPIYMS